MNRRDLDQIQTAKRNGIVIPVRAYRAAEKAGIPYAVACAFLMQESAGGQNVFGHDPTQFVGAGKVTKKKYLTYRERRRAGKGMQGVGPMQLTWWEFQDAADEMGGCWKPYVNMLFAFQLLARYREAHGNWRDAARQYNGSGPAAEAYADRVKQRI